MGRIYPPELQLNKVNASETETQIWDLHLSISNGFVLSKIYYKQDDFNFDMVTFPFLVGAFLALLLMGSTYLNFGLLECIVM